jgi:hypothetical protein
MLLVLLETSGNQNYIFSTNKLRENIGASELTYRSGTKWVLDAVANVRDSNSLWDANSDVLRQNLLDRTKNPHLDSNNPSDKVEVIVATSGKALLLVRDLTVGKDIIRQATRAALKEAPGVDLCGAISKGIDWSKSGGLGEAIREVHEVFEITKSKRPSPELRFLRLPVVDECATSGLPAASMDRDVEGGKLQAYSAVSLAKQRNHQYGERRVEVMLQQYVHQQEQQLKLSRSFTFLTEDTKWLAIIHADGNGLGEIFLNFDKHICKHLQQQNVSVNDNRFYADRLREFSLALDICTEKAFATSLLETFPDKYQTKLPIAPLVLGGDDLTVVCDARYALPFTVKFLQEFEQETSRSQNVGNNTIDIIPQLAEIALGESRLSACAGVAIVKPHFPFSVAYHLAEQLLKSAKHIKTQIVHRLTADTEIGQDKEIHFPSSALDFHVLYDSSGTDLETIREKQRVDDGRTYLYNSPYVVTLLDRLPENSGKAWAERHHWDSLYEKAQALIPNIDDDRKLPSSQIHDLRSHLYLGKDAADGFYKLIQGRYRLEALEGDAGSLFQRDPESPDLHTTSLLDAMNVMSLFNMETTKDR